VDLNGNELYMPTKFSIKFLLVYISAFLFAVHGFAQPSNDNKDNALVLTELLNWCSDDAAFTSVKASDDGVKGSCLKNGPNFNTWFKFQSTTGIIQVEVKTGDSKGSMRFSYIALFDQYDRELECEEYKDEYGDVGFTYSNLDIGSWYYISVDHPYNSKYVGTYTLCVNDELGYDYKDGAIELLNFNNWCSPNAAYSTKAASPDEAQPPCLKNGPNFNRWFKFYARSQEVELKLLIGGEKGTLRFPYMTLWDVRMRPLECTKYKSSTSNQCVLNHKGLTKGNWYYVSIDHPNNSEYQGSFSLCINRGSEDDQVKNDLVIIRGRLMYNLYDPVFSLITLTDGLGKVLKTTNTDETGKFKFEGLPPELDYVVIVEEYVPGQDIAIIQTNFEGKIIKKAYREEKNVFRFKQLPPNCHYIGLLDCIDPGLIPTAGNVGIIGAIVDKNDPTEGKQNMNVFLYNTPSKVVDSTKTDKVGKFRFNNLPEGDSYLIKIEEQVEDIYVEMLMVNDRGMAIKASTMRNMDKNGFFQFEELPYIETHLAPMKLEDVGLEAMEVGASIQLSNIYFDQGKHELKPESYPELDKLAAILNIENQIKIEVSGHTDNIGTRQFNLTLSENRAKAVVDYLISKSVAKERLTYRGFGSMKPLSKNDTEAERRKNRRVEFKVVK